MSILFPFYVVLMTAFGRLTSFLGPKIPRFKDQTSDRFPNEALKAQLAAERNQWQRSVLFFASSAGEYEQALPLASQLRESDPDCGIFIVIFSQSGIRFAKSQGETLTIIKAPWDDYFAWKDLLSILKPTYTIIVRYELWPAFLRRARSYGQVILINAVKSRSSENSKFSCWVQTRLLKHVDLIFAVSDRDRDFIVSKFNYPENSIVVCGDSKYDRVRERIALRNELREQLDVKLSARWPRKKRLVLGSGWHEDVKTLLDAFIALGQERNKWQLIIAPHDVSSGMIRWIKQRCDQLGLPSCQFSQLDVLSKNDGVLIIDCIGILPELYGCADLAFVGGAMHYRVHNVLEPAVRGLPLCFGSKYHTSQEASHLANLGLAAIIKDAEDLRKFLEPYTTENKIENPQLKEEVERLCGATSRMMNRLQEGIPNE